MSDAVDTDDVNEKYESYAMLAKENNETEKKLSNIKRALSELRGEIAVTTKDGSIALDISAHAYWRSATRLEKLAMESMTIFRDLFRIENPTDSLILPSNLEVFLYKMLTRARKDGRISPQPSKGGTSTEYHYFVEIDEWSDDNNRLQFVGIVERNVLKTVYFNWI